MIRFLQGNLFESRAEALVNTVNCVGVMGKGIAYQFKRAYPEMHSDYVRRCKAGEVRLGEVSSFRERGKLVVNFPTKSHWRSSSNLKDIRTGLRALRTFLVANEIKSIAIPPLGCGNGGLAWSDVKELIELELGELDGVDVEVYTPAVQFESKVANEPRLSIGHFVLAALRSELKTPTKLNIQKAAYFFNVFWGESYFRFTDYRFGPYSVALDPMFAVIRDYLSFARVEASELARIGATTKLKGPDADRFGKMLTAVRAAADYCNARQARLELLATAHAVVDRSPDVAESEIIERFLAWSQEKSERFEPDDVRSALEQLESDGLVKKTLLGYATKRPAQGNLGEQSKTPLPN
jgi:O-acetyl-ADP-ribose deacetylase (regulator of RNase III)